MSLDDAFEPVEESRVDAILAELDVELLLASPCRQSRRPRSG